MVKFDQFIAMALYFSYFTYFTWLNLTMLYLQQVEFNQFVRKVSKIKNGSIFSMMRVRGILIPFLTVNEWMDIKMKMIEFDQFIAMDQFVAMTLYFTYFPYFTWSNSASIFILIC